MSTNDRVSVGLVGLSGYSGAILRLLQAEAARDDGRVRLASVFAPDPENHGDQLEELGRAGVHACDSYDAMLASDVDAVWLPVPIHLHLPMAEAALRAGKAVMIEKPVAGCIDDHDTLARVADEVGGTVLVGFQHLYRPASLALKRRLLAGDFGTPRSAIVWGLWPRSETYYRRNGWAGALRRDGTWVLDSPLNNAMSHFVSVALYLLGDKLDTAASPTAVTAELWRGRRAIENYDTCSLRATLDVGCDMIVLYSHATSHHLNPHVAIDTDRGTLHMEFGGKATFTPTGGSAMVVADDWNEDPQCWMVRALASVIRGESCETAVATLAASRPHTLLVSATSQAAAVVDVPGDRVEWREKNGETFAHIPHLAEDLKAAAAKRQTLGEHGVDLPTAPGTLTDLADYRHFTGPKSRP